MSQLPPDPLAHIDPRANVLQARGRGKLFAGKSNSGERRTASPTPKPLQRSNCSIHTEGTSKASTFSPRESPGIDITLCSRPGVHDGKAATGETLGRFHSPHQDGENPRRSSSDIYISEAGSHHHPKGMCSVVDGDEGNIGAITAVQLQQHSPVQPKVITEAQVREVHSSDSNLSRTMLAARRERRRCPTAPRDRYQGPRRFHDGWQ